jgi:hypothetical protein
MRSRTSCLLVVLVLLAALGCSRAVTWATTERATWSYVREAWGGVLLGSPIHTGAELRLPFNLDVKSAKRMDSGVCVCGVRARLDGTRIVVAFYKCVCGPGATGDLTAMIARPRAGAYSVVYDDKEAGYPVIGSIQIEQ